MPNCNCNQPERMTRNECAPSARCNPSGCAHQHARVHSECTPAVKDNRSNCLHSPMEHSCDFDYDLSNLPLGMAYVPWQHFHNVYEVDKALGCGTIFPELYKPFLGKRGVRT